ncbi:MAG: DNA repair protein RecN [Defluviitaleaceae bacterium]|nr:DNA repair protein RecN [Defluviitaleaceae bacterium]
MIEQLTIKNIAIIEELTVNFNSSLNILSGETGAGKSIIIDSLSFLLGSKTPISVRAGAEVGEVLGVFFINEKNREEVGNIAPLEEDGKILISRTISSKKNTIKINGKTSTLAILRELSAMLIDIHGQFEHSYLINEAKHIGLLDWFCNPELVKIKENLAASINEYKNINEKITSLSEKASEERILLLNEYIEEFELLKLKPNEEDQIAERLKFLHNYKDNSENLSKAAELVYYDALLKITEAKKLLRNTQYEEQLESLRISLDDLGRDLKSTNLKLDMNELVNLELRFSEIQKLKRKHIREYDELLTYHKELIDELEGMQNLAQNLNELNILRKDIQGNIVKDCETMHNFRLEAKQVLEIEITKTLKDLNMPNVIFNVSIEKKQSLSANGNDNVSFLISPNLGEELKPLAKIASGGEMSRVMLALKSTLAKNNKTQTFVFDEIDTGVSGRTAQKIAEKLGIMSKEKQILCISHLPQIAAMADSHFLIEKVQHEGKTRSNMRELLGDEIINELARLIGGAKITENTLNAANEMKELAINLKNS